MIWNRVASIRAARSAPAIGMLALLVVAVPAGAQQSAALTPTYSQTFTDAVTGPNCSGMTRTGGCRSAGWFVTPGADVYANDVYERPTSQTFTGATPVASEYLGYLDLVTAQYGFDQRYMYFQLNMYSPFLYKNDGTVDQGVFGSGTQYGVQLGSAAVNGVNDGQLLLRGEQTIGTLGTSSSAFNSAKTQGWYDRNNTVAGPGGVNTPNEESLIPNFDGYEHGVIQTDGYLAGSSPQSYVLFARSFVNLVGNATVELALDYLAYNAYCATQTVNCSINPASLPYLVFETTRGLKDNQNYLWNDKYNASEAGSPYGSGTLQNIYELDNMRVGSTVIPEPSTFALAFGGLVGLGVIARRRRQG